jgi:hypothetical protein
MFRPSPGAIFRPWDYKSIVFDGYPSYLILSVTVVHNSRTPNHIPRVGVILLMKGNCRRVANLTECRNEVHKIRTPCLLKGGDKSRLKPSIQSCNKLWNCALHHAHVCELGFIVGQWWFSHCRAVRAGHCGNDGDGGVTWLLISSKNGHIFRLRRWEDPPSEVRLARGVLRGEVSIASCLGYSVCGASEATRWGKQFLFFCMALKRKT